MEDEREEIYSPAQGSKDQQMSPEVSALSRTPTPASICPVSSPIQRPIRIHQQRSHRKFLLAIPAITVLAVAAVVLFYAITWNDSPPPNRSVDLQARKEEASKSASGRMSDFGDDDLQQGPSQRDGDIKKNANSDFSSSNEISMADSKDKSGGDSSEDSFSDKLPPAGLGGREKNPGWHVLKATTEKEHVDEFEQVPWPNYSDMNFTDEDMYSEEMLFKVDKLLSQKKTKHPFFIDLVESKRNFTDANKYCKHRNGYLMQLFNVQEELYFSRVLAHSELFHSKCKNGFLGFRKILEEDIKVRGFKVATFANPLSGMSEVWVKDGRHEMTKGGCVVLYHNESSHTFGLAKIPCKNKMNCYLCETARGCPAPSCYYWHYKMNATVTYNEAKELCVSEKGGKLARIRNKVTLNLLKEALNVSVANSIFNLYSENACSQGYIVEKEQLGLGEFGFENVDEQQIAYKSPAIMLVKQDMVDGSYCLVVSREHGFRWMPVPCTDQRCFFCRYDRA